MGAATRAGRTLRADAGRKRRRRPRRLGRSAAVVSCLIATLAGGYFLWLRDSALVAVEETKVTGLTTGNAKEIRAALSESALGMTTLHVDRAELERAVAAYPAVASVETSSDLPHGLTIEVVERRPIAAVEGPEGKGVPVAGDGTLLPDFDPAYPLAQLPGSTSGTTGTLADEVALAALAAVDAAPEGLRGEVEAIGSEEGEGLVAVLRHGPRVLLGDGSELEAKWAAAAAAIAGGEVTGAEYLDVSLPRRPAAG